MVSFSHARMLYNKSKDFNGKQEEAGSVKEVSDKIEKRRRQDSNVDFLKCLLRIRLFNRAIQHWHSEGPRENGLVVLRSEQGNTHSEYTIYEICL